MATYYPVHSRYRIFNSEPGQISLYRGNSRLQLGGAADFGAPFRPGNPVFRFDDQYDITYFGKILISAINPQQFFNEAGEQISPNGIPTEIDAYFESIGLGIAGGGSVDLSNYYTKQQVDEGFVSKSEYQEQISFILEQLGIQQLDSPSLTAGTITQTSITVNIASVANAESYELFRNGVSIFVGQAGAYLDDNLTPGVEYNYGAEAIADGYARSNRSALVVSTLPAQQTQLPAGTLDVGTITANSISVIGSVVPNATLYRFIRNSVVVTTQANPSYTFTGLSADSPYTLGRVALANGYDDSPVVQVNATTKSGQQINLNNPWNDNDSWNDTLIWNEAA